MNWREEVVPLLWLMLAAALIGGAVYLSIPSS